MAGPPHNRSTVADIWVGVVVAVVGGLILSGILQFIHPSSAPAQPTFINKIEPTFNNKIQLPPPDAKQAPTTIKDQRRSIAPPVAERDAQPSGNPAVPKTVADAPAPIPYFGYSTSDPNQITAISYLGFPMGVIQNRALDAYFLQIFNAVPRTDGQSHVSRILVLNAERTDVSSEGCSLATQISISYYFKAPQGKRITEDRIAKGRPACLSDGAEQADRAATESAMAAVARAID